MLTIAIGPGDTSLLYSYLRWHLSVSYSYSISKEPMLSPINSFSLVGITLLPLLGNATR